MTEAERKYNLKRPPHLIAGQVLRDMEVIANVKFGPQSSAPVHRLVEQYQNLLSTQDQKVVRHPQVEKAAAALQQVASASGLPKEVYHLLSALRDSGLIDQP